MLTTTGMNQSSYINGAVARDASPKVAVQSKPQSFISWVAKSMFGTDNLGPGGSIQLRHEEIREANRLLHAA